MVPERPAGQELQRDLRRALHEGQGHEPFTQALRVEAGLVQTLDVEGYAPVIQDDAVVQKDLRAEEHLL